MFTSRNINVVCCLVLLLAQVALAKAVWADDQVVVTLHPGPTVTTGQSRVVAFGVPFPPDELGAAATIQIVDASGNEVPARQERTLLWRDFDTSNSTSTRALLVHAQVTFASSAPLKLTLRFDSAHSTTLAAQPPVTQTWVPISSDSSFFPNEYPAAEGITEPAVYATFDKTWLSRVMLRSQTLPTGEVALLDWYDTATVEFGKTLVNDVSPNVTEENLINYLEKPAPWLFDRAMSLQGLYLRTGDLKWLRHAHRATQFYAKRIDDSGYFNLKPGDLKYSYGQAMLANMVLTGDVSLLDNIDRTRQVGESWSSDYSIGRNFWTERHHAYSFLASLSAWEATGSAATRVRLQTMIQNLHTQIFSPPAPLPADNCAIHTFRQHEGYMGDVPICSPWMTALLAEAVWRYYNVSGDEMALNVLSAFGDFIDEYALRDTSLGLVPWYLASSEIDHSNSGQYADWEHTCDVWGLGMRAAYAKLLLNQPNNSLLGQMKGLESSCERVLDNWHRPGSDVSSNRPQWRLSPPRKYNWWFGTTFDMPFFFQVFDQEQLFTDSFE